MNAVRPIDCMTEIYVSPIPNDIAIGGIGTETLSILESFNDNILRVERGFS